MRRIDLIAFTIVWLTFLSGTSYADSAFDLARRGNSDIGKIPVLDAGGYPQEGTGLAVEGGKRHDTSPGYFLQFAGKGIASISIETIGGSWAIFGSNSLGQQGALLAYGSGEKIVTLANIDNGYSHLSVTGRGRGHVDLNGVAAAAVPEPGSPALILTTGLIGLAEMVRRRLISLLS